MPDLYREIYRHNREAWNRRTLRRDRHTERVTAEQIAQPAGRIDPEGWMGNVRDRRILCLAAGGGRQSALYAAAGARVTVVDISDAMLDQDRQVAREFGFDIRCLQTSMDDLSALGDATFDFVVQPVSTCYVPDIAAVYREVARVLETDGLYISQHKQPGNLQTDTAWRDGGYAVRVPYPQRTPLPPVAAGSLHREADTYEFLHRWEDLVGELCRAGFVIEDLNEPRLDNPRAAPGSFEHRSHFVPPYVRIKARRIAQRNDTSPAPSLWIPGR